MALRVPRASKGPDWGRARVVQRALPRVLDTLEARGAERIRRRPARFDGTVEVRWREPRGGAVPVRDLAGDLRPWLPAHGLAAVLVTLVLVVFCLVTVFGGGLG